MAYEGIAPVSFESVSAVTATPSVDVGTRRTYAGKDYRYVYNAGGAQISVKNAAIYSAVSGYSVTVSSVTNLNHFIAGVCVHATLTTATYGWLLTEGFATVEMGADNSAAAGAGICLGTDGKFARVVSANTDVMQGQRVGVAMVAIASGGSGTAYLRF